MTTIEDGASRIVHGGASQPVHVTNDSLPAATPPTGASATQVQGTAATGAAAVGNPVRVAGQEITTGLIRPLLTGVSGALIAQIGRASDGLVGGFGTPGDAQAVSNGNFVVAYPLLFNGTNYDRPRNNYESTTAVLASAARTATTNSSDLINHNGQSIALTINVTAGAGFSIVPSISVKENANGLYFGLLSTAPAITATGAYMLIISPIAVTSVSAWTNNRAAIADFVLRNWRFTMTHGNANSVTYSVYVNYL